MKFLAFALTLLMPCLALASGNMKTLGTNDALARTRAGIPISGSPTQITVSAVSAATAQLTAGAVYSIVCDTAVYIEWNDSSPTVTSADGYLPQNTMIYWVTGSADETTNTARYVGALRVTADGKCYVTRWR